MAKKPHSQNTALYVETLLSPALEELGLKIWDIKFEKEGPDFFLRVFIYKDTPLDMQSCEEATRVINPILDEADPISQSYYLEVGSPGLGRKLTRQEHFDSLNGSEVMAHLIRKNEDGERDIKGVLVKRDAKTLTLLLNEKEIEIENADISYVKLCDDEDLF